MPIGVITLGAGHSMISGYKPGIVEDTILAAAITENSKNQETHSFGLFGGGLNYNTYYPEVDVKDLVPKTEDFIEPTFRLLSECIISKYYPTDFSVGGVLKKSMPLLVGQTINCDHDSEVGNAIGVVRNTFWQEAYTDPSGVKIPAGINGIMKIDAKSNPRLARGILMEPPSINSNSVTIKFVWEKSHPEMSDGDFYEKMGSYDKEGVLIRRIVTDIVAYAETSLVSNGADPFAKMVKNGKIILPEKAGRIYNSYSEDPTMAHQAIFSDFKNLGKISVMSNSEDTPYFVGHNEYEPEKKDNANNISTKINQNQMNELQQFLASLFTGEGVLSLAEGQEITGELALTAIKEMVTEKTRLATEVGTLTTQLEGYTELKETVETNKPILEYGTAQLAALRTSTLEDYRKVYAEEDETIVSLINTGDHKTVTSLSKSYQASLEEKYPMSCKECGSHNVNRSASIENSGGSEGGEEQMSTSSAIAMMRKKRLNGE